MIRSISPADRTAVAAVLTDAFTEHELFVWALPDATTRRDVLAAYFSVEMHNGEVRVHEQDGQILGVAVWLDGSEPSLPQRAWLPVARAALRLLGPYSIARALYRGWRADRSVHRARPDTHPPVLGWLAVSPHAQGGGIGRALVNDGIEHFPGDAYLECSASLINYYSRLGFSPVKSFALGAGGPVFTAMSR